MGAALRRRLKTDGVVVHRTGLPCASKRLPLPVRVDQAARWLTVEDEVRAIQTFQLLCGISLEQATALDSAISGK